MGTALCTMPSTGGGRPPAGKFTTPGAYLRRERDSKVKGQPKRHKTQRKNSHTLTAELSNLRFMDAGY